MFSWQKRTLKYFHTVVGTVVLIVVALLLHDHYQYRQVDQSLTAYMDNLRDMIFMSTYESLKKGNMKVFKGHLTEIGTFGDVREFSLLNRQGVVRYSSNPGLVKQSDSEVRNLGQLKNRIRDGYTTYYFPVETVSYCSRCHPDWETGTINSYYKLTLSRKALDAAQLSMQYSYAFTILGGVIFLGFVYLLLTLYERRRHEEQMQLAISVFEHAIEAIAITGADGCVERINNAFTDITGYTEDEIIGKPIQHIDAGEVNAEAHREMHEQLTAIGRWSGELWNLRKDGEMFAIRLSVTAVHNIKSRLTHFISIFHDISAKKAAERALIDMDRMKSEFISTAAHELRTPLNAIMNYTELLREPEKFGGLSTQQVNTFLDQVYDRGEALNRLIGELLDVSRIERGSPIELQYEEVDLIAILERMVEFYRIHDPGHDYRFVLPEKSEPATCRIDRHRINQVLTNLLSNALKYSPKETVVNVSLQRDGDYWVIVIEDRGVGMTPEQVARVFDKFYRAETVAPDVSGLGLGMSIARQIVESHGGKIWIRSTPGAGTRVSFSLPV